MNEEEARKQIKKCIEEGRVEWKDDPGLVNRKKGPASINSIEFFGPWKRTEDDGRVVGNEGGVEIHWSKPGVGFGELVFVMKNGKLECDSECMGRKFVQEVLLEFLDMSIFRSGRDEGPLRCAKDGCEEAATHRAADEKRYCQQHAEEIPWEDPSPS